MKRIHFLAVSLALTVLAAAAQLPALPLWPEGAPSALGTADKDIPTLTPYLVAGNRSDADGISACEPLRGLAARASPCVGEFCRGAQRHVAEAERMSRLRELFQPMDTAKPQRLVCLCKRKPAALEALKKSLPHQNFAGGP